MDLRPLPLLVGAILGLFTIILVYTLLMVERAKTKKAKTGKEAPQPAGAWPVIGHLRLIEKQENLGRVLGAMADEYGPAFMLRLGVRRMLVLGNWEVAKEGLATNDKVLATHPSSAAGKHMGYDNAMIGFAPYGAYWRELRKISTLELLSNARLETLRHVRAAEVDTAVRELYGRWVENRGRPVKVEMRRWLGEVTFNIIVKIVAGKQRCFDAGEEAAAEVARRLQKATEEFFVLVGTFVTSDALPFLEWMDIGGYQKAMKRAMREMDAILGGWLEEHRQRRLSGEAAGGTLDFVDVMLSIMEKAKLSSSTYDPDVVVKATALSMMLGGTDTAAITLSWALSLLLNNRDALRKAQEEIDAHVGKDRHVDESDVKNLPYLQAVVKETFRLYPPVPVLVPHEAMEDCRIGGYHVPAGTRVTVNIWRIQRDPRVWTDPSEFDPERFLTSRHADVDVRGQHFELMPFGSGRRACPGISFALQVVHLTLARLLHGFDLGTPADAPVDMTEGYGATLPKATPLDILCAPRLPPELYKK